MFLVNSRHPLLTATPECFRSKIPTHAGAHLLPKLRCNFAEFLNQGCLKRLRILMPSLCRFAVRASLAQPLEDFLVSMNSPTCALDGTAYISPQLTDLPISLFESMLGTYHVQWVGSAILLRLSLGPQRWYRNVDRLSITYDFRPRLRPD